MPAPPTNRPTGPARRSGALRTPLLVVGGLGAAAVAVALADPRVNHVPLCPSRALTGLDCPFCGGLRSVASLVRGRVAEAFSYNLLVTGAIPLIIGGLLLWTWRLRVGRTVTVPGWIQPVGWTLAIAFAVVRNLPWFTWLNSAG